MKKFKIVLLVVFLVVAIILVICWKINSSKSTIQEAKDLVLLQSVKADNASITVDMEKALFNKEITAQQIDKYLDDTVKLILISECGQLEINHDKTPQNDWWNEWLFDSNMRVLFNYKLIVSIPASSIWAELEDNEIVIRYRYKDIDVECVSFDDIVPVTQRSAFGDAYSPEEVVAIETLAVDRIQENAKSSSDLFIKAEANLIETLSSKLKQITGEVYSIRREDEHLGY